MKESEKIFKEMVHYWNELELNYEKYLEYDNQSAARRARLASIRLRKLVSPFRLTTVSESKKGITNEKI